LLVQRLLGNYGGAAALGEIDLQLVGVVAHPAPNTGTFQQRPSKRRITTDRRQYDDA